MTICNCRSVGAPVDSSRSVSTCNGGAAHLIRERAGPGRERPELLHLRVAGDRSGVIAMPDQSGVDWTEPLAYREEQGEDGGELRTIILCFRK